jgi:hypothetical protein
MSLPRVYDIVFTSEVKLAILSHPHHKCGVIDQPDHCRLWGSSSLSQHFVQSSSQCGSFLQHPAPPSCVVQAYAVLARSVLRFAVPLSSQMAICDSIFMANAWSDYDCTSLGSSDASSKHSESGPLLSCPLSCICQLRAYPWRTAARVYLRICHLLVLSRCGSPTTSLHIVGYFSWPCSRALSTPLYSEVYNVPVDRRFVIACPALTSTKCGLYAFLSSLGIVRRTCAPGCGIAPQLVGRDVRIYFSAAFARGVALVGSPRCW